MAIIITYDVPTKHTELKKTLFDQGYVDQIQGKECETIYFPNTTLYHDDRSSEQAISDVQTSCKTLKIKLERCVSTIWDDWFVICGVPFK